MMWEFPSRLRSFFEGKLGLGLLGEAEFGWQELNWTQTWKSRACEPPIFEISPQLTLSTISSSLANPISPKRTLLGLLHCGG